MLKYTECAASPLEIPNEISLCVYISGCLNHCPECHYPELQDANYGDLLINSYLDMINAYKRQISCVCFMGEGSSSNESRKELITYAKLAKENSLKTAIYSGRDTSIETWMHCFDYIKLGSYQKDKGDLSSKTTNQVLYKREGFDYINITHLFWNE